MTTQPTVKTTHTRLRDFYPTPEVRRETEGYRSWLVQQSRREEKREDRVAYSRAALTPFAMTGRRIFAPWNEKQSAYKILTKPQSFFLVVLFLVAIGVGYFLHIEALTIALGLVTTLYLVQLAIHAFVVVRELSHEETSGVDQRVLDNLRTAPWPTYTILCPLYKEAAVVPQFIKAMQALDYPTDRLQILLLTEEEDSTTRVAIHKQGQLPAHFQVMTVPHGEPRTKPRACNYGLLHTTGRYVVIFDAEDIPEPAQLKKAVLAFADGGPKLACVQAELSFYNQTQNILTHIFSIEYLTWFALVLPALARAGFALPLGGTSNHFQASVLRALGGWDAYNVTEDCDLGMRVHQYGFETGMLASTTFEEATSQIGNWIRQRSRWIKGFMQTYLVHTRHPLQALTKGRGHTLLSLQAIIGGSFVVFINPLMWLLLVVYIAFRGQVEGVYQILFPAPVLYGGALCLIGGNFYFVYMSMLICAKREQYNLVPWCFLLSLYWFLMSVAGVKALFQLITRPHYWEKTRHGLHLGKGPQVDLVEVVRAATNRIEDEETVLLPSTKSGLLPLSTTTERVRAIETLPVKAVSNTLVTTREKKRDYWLWATMMVASICSIGAMIYSFGHQDILLYGDSYSHMYISRSVIDSITPGFGQLGTVWLPLPHLLMLPFIWNTWLWTTGLAGGIPSMIFYIIAALYIFSTARRLTKNNWASFVGTLVFILNPNVIYLQTTPLTEPLCFMTFAMAGYYFVTWAQKDRINYLVIAASVAFLATLARYDGWFLFASMFVLTALIGLVKKKSWQHIRSDLFLFGLVSGFGIILWLVWNKMIFGDSLAFMRNIYSSKQQMSGFSSVMQIVTHNLWQSVRYYGFTCLGVLGPIITILTLIAVTTFIARRRALPEMLASLSFLTPLSFYPFSFYTGNVISLSPGTSSILFNNRFGTEAILPAALFMAILVNTNIKLPHVKRWANRVLPLILLLVVITQSLLIVKNGIVVLEEGQGGQGSSGCQISSVNVYLAQHYNGGIILQDTYLGSPNESQILGIPQRNVIYQGSQQYWKQALRNPGAIADWVIIGRRSVNPYPIQINTASPLFKSEFTLVMHQDFDLYIRRGLPPLPNRPLPGNLILTHVLAEHPYCRTGNHQLFGGW